MPDPTFEARLTSQLSAFAEGGVRPIDRYAIAEATIAAGGAERILGVRLGAVRPTSSRLALQISFMVVLLVALAVGVALVGSRLLDLRPDADTPDQPAVVVPTADRSAAPKPARIDAIVPTGSMAHHRVSHTATVLEDGRVLIVGGFDYGQDRPPSRETAEIYDPATGSFSSAGPLADVRDLGHSATRLADGRVLVVGGTNPDPSPGERDVLASAEIFDPRTGTSSPTGSLSTPRFEHAAVRLPDGRVAIIGGSAEPPIADGFVPSIEIFDPTTATFGQGPSLTIFRRRGQEPGMLEAAVLGDGRVFIVTRWNGEDANTDVAAIWDPTTGEVRETTAFGDPGSAAGASPTAYKMVGGIAVLDDGRVLMTVLDPARTVWGFIAFDPTTERFSFLAAFPGPPFPGPPNFLNTLPVPVITKLSDGRILLVAGDAAGCSTVRAFIFEPSTSAVAPVGLAPLTRLGTCNGGVGVSVSPLADGNALIAGGHLSGGESVTDASLLRHTVTAPTASP